MIGPVIQVHITQFLGTHRIEIQIPSTTTTNRNSWVVTCRGKTRSVDELHFRDPGHNPTNSELLLERSIANESEPCSTELEQSRIEETHATQFEIPTNPVYYAKEVVPFGERKWSKLVVRVVRRYDQDERETHGAVHWNSVVPKLRKAFQKSGGRKFSDTDWPQYFFERSNKMRFQYCMNSNKSLLYIRAIQGHTGGNLIAPELMGHGAFSI